MPARSAVDPYRASASAAALLLLLFAAPSSGGANSGGLVAPTPRPPRPPPPPPPPPRPPRPPSPPPRSPHVLFVLVDDLGWGDVGFNRKSDATPGVVGAGGRDYDDDEVRTPNLDDLAASGVRLTRHYVHSSCTGTRCSAQSGRFPVHVQTSLKNPEDPTSGMPRDVTGLAEHMRDGGYRTHYVGKWDAGMASPGHLPRGRGYETSLGYFEHKNDYWTQGCMQSACCRRFGGGGGDDGGGDGWEGPSPERFYDLSLTDLWDTDRPALGLNGTDYEELIFLRRMLGTIDDHDPAEPLFLFYAPHVAHCPLQVPRDYLDRFDFVTDDTDACRAQTPNILPPSDRLPPPPFSCRRQYRAMVSLLDDIVGNVTKRLEDRGMWDDTVVVFTSDNGGPIGIEESGSTNWPLRGGKYTDFEGGVRAAAFVSGGYLPPDMRGTVRDGPVHIADWYVTLPALVGVKAGDVRAREAGLPGIDGVDVWPYLRAGDRDLLPRTEIPLSSSALIDGDYKLIWGGSVKGAGWSGPYYPNASSTREDVELASLDCEGGCLFDVAHDPGEHNDLAGSEPERTSEMKSRLEELRGGFYENDDAGRDSCPPGIDMPCACWAAVNYYGGFLGPYQEVELGIAGGEGAVLAPG